MDNTSTNSYLISTDLNFCHSCDSLKFSDDSSFNPTYTVQSVPSATAITTPDSTITSATISNITASISSATLSFTFTSISCSWCGNSNLESYDESCEDTDYVSGDGCSNLC